MVSTALKQETHTSHNKFAEGLKDGNYFFFNNFTQKQDFYGCIKQIILRGIEKIEGRECRQEIEKNGLSQMHLYFPVDKLMYLDVYVREKSRKIMMQMAYSFCKHDLKFTSEFFISPDDFLFKISYPFEIAVKSKVSYKQYVAYKQARSQKTIPLNSYQFLRKVKQEVKARIKDIPKSSTLATKGYHDHYPYAANAYGPHLDSWYGSALDGINLWWAIAGVKEDNSMIFYPEMFGRYIKYKQDYAYLPPGVTLTKPYKVEIPDGSVLVFNSDLLHGSQLNISTQTRIVTAPRVILGQPKFNSDSQPMEFSGWYSSEDIAKGNWENPRKFSMKEKLGIVYEDRKKSHVEKRIAITVNSSLSDGTPIELCPAETIGIGEKMLVNLQKESIIVFRTKEGFQAVAALCPHMKINLIDGFHDEQQIYCPGHGVAFFGTDGSSKCKLLKLQVYKAYESKGKIFLEKEASTRDTKLKRDNKENHVA
ncbi:MAG: Rieske 2Fe-2S domain-containing protein [Cyanobacteriota bacterium]